MTIETGGSAFPCEGGNKFISGNEIRKTLPSSGMTIRDYFAGQELSKMNAVACCDIPDAYARQAEHCYRMADAMLAARTK